MYESICKILCEVLMVIDVSSMNGIVFLNYQEKVSMRMQNPLMVPEYEINPAELIFSEITVTKVKLCM